MSNKDEKTKGQKKWRQSTKLVRGGLDRSHHGELSEALYLTQAYAYDSAEQAEQSFNGEIDHYVYSRYGNPTVSMFENRLALLEGADHCRGLASGMAAVYCSLASQLKAGDRVVASRALFGGCEYVINTALPKFGVEVEFRPKTSDDGHRVKIDAVNKIKASPFQLIEIFVRVMLGQLFTQPLPQAFNRI